METNAQNGEQPPWNKAVFRADLVRAKLITSFKLQDKMPDHSVPKFRAKDVFEDDLLKHKGEETHNLVHFKISPCRSEAVTEECRRLALLHNRQSKYPPLNMFAHWILESKVFNTIIICCIILDALVLALQAEVSANGRSGLHVHKLVLDVVEACILVMFLMEVLLQWLDDFWHFWRNTWNVFDFTVTLVSVLPKIIKLFRPDARDQVVEFLHNLRILRCFKLLPKFTNFRVILQSIANTLATMLPIFGLLLMIAYIFAMTGVVWFENYSRSTMEGLVFKDSFVTLSSAFVTLFMVFTLDHWYALMAEMISVPEISTPLCYVYIVLWLLIASFTFRNIVLGVMAKKFQVIRSTLRMEVEQLELHAKVEDTSLHRTTHHSDEDLKEGEPADGTEDPDGSLEERDWQAYVQENMKVLRDQASKERVTWPKDKLLRYFELLELLQGNLDERRRLHDRLVQQLSTVGMQCQARNWTK